MKYFPFLLLAILLSCSTVSQAQRHGRGSYNDFDYQVRAGVNFSQIDGDASGNYNKIGFHASVGTSMPLNDDGRLRFGVEIGLTQKGSSIESNNFSRRISLLYVEVPLMVSYDFLDNHKLRIGAGVAPAILAKAKVTTDKVVDKLQSDNYKTFDLLPLCAGIRYNITDAIAVDARYYNSMLNIAKENGSGTYRITHSNKGQFNRLIQAGIVLTF